MRVFEFVEREKAQHAVKTMCRVLGVSTSGYYDWRLRPASKRRLDDEVLSLRICEIHAWSRRNYGAPRVFKHLRSEGVHVGKKRVARLMRAQSLQGACVRRKFRTTVRNDAAKPAADLVDRNFTAAEPDRLWVADITYVRTWSGWLYLAYVLDIFSRRVVGWSMREHLRAELVVEALEMAIHNRRPNDGLIHHSDHGCQYTSFTLGRRLVEHGILPSMGSVGDAYDNALMEAFFATLEKELLNKHSFRNRGEARLAIFDYIEVFYNRQRMHTSIGDMAPVEFERRWSETGVSVA